MSSRKSRSWWPQVTTSLSSAQLGLALASETWAFLSKTISGLVPLPRCPDAIIGRSPVLAAAVEIALITIAPNSSPSDSSSSSSTRVWTRVRGMQWSSTPKRRSEATAPSMTLGWVSRSR